MAPTPTRHLRRARVVALTLGISTTLAVLRVLWAPPESLADLAGAYVVVVAAVLGIGAAVSAFRTAWRRDLKHQAIRAGTGLVAFTRTTLRSERASAPPARLRRGQRLALVCGISLCLLDVVLTALLLRDIFPEPPYRFENLGLGPGQESWAFYAVIAAFKTLLELWFGMLTPQVTRARLMVLGAASAFDALLAGTRAMILAEQGIEGGVAMASNLVFIAFGLAIPWVAAHTGTLLSAATDGILEAMGLSRWLRALPRVLLVVVVWSVAIAIGLPTLVTMALLGVTGCLWFALEDFAAMLLGQPQPQSTPIVWLEESVP